jgi:hypothetical protein
MISIRTDSYNQANQLIAALAEADIEAGITEGGVTLRVTPDQIPLSSQIAASYGLTLTAGNAILWAVDGKSVSQIKAKHC